MTKRPRLRRLLAAGWCSAALTVGALVGVAPVASASTSATLGSTIGVVSPPAGIHAYGKVGGAGVSAFAPGAVAPRESVITSGGAKTGHIVPDATPTYCNANEYGGRFFCGTLSWYTMPNGFGEAFAVGPDHAIWTTWQTPTGQSNWVSLSGYCINTGSPVGIGNVPGYDNWTWYVNCTGGDGNAWYITRFGSSNGSATWSNWQSPPTWAPVATVGVCYMSGGWGGSFFCGTPAWYLMPTGYAELFVVGTDHAIWTRWSSPSGLSSWVSLSGYCINAGSPIGIGNVPGYDNWTWYVNCTGGDGAAWYDTRFGSSNGTGTWNGWTSVMP